MIRSIMAFATVSADWLEISVIIINVNLVRWSIMERIMLHLTPAAEVDSELYIRLRSTEILWNGCSTGR